MNYFLHDTQDLDIEEEVKNFLNYLHNPAFPHEDIDIANYFRTVLKRFKENQEQETLKYGKFKGNK